SAGHRRTESERCQRLTPARPGRLRGRFPAVCPAGQSSNRRRKAVHEPYRRHARSPLGCCQAKAGEHCG
nr:hypothetical protein [Tanacetum cinerariifolium]